MAALAEKKRAIEEKKKATLAAAEERRKEVALLKKQQQQLRAPEPSPRKRLKRNDVNRLDIGASPRAKAQCDTSWEPPRKNGNKWDEPGDAWAEDAKLKLSLLTMLRKLLQDNGVLPQPISLNVVMEHLDEQIRDLDLDFNGRVFLYLVFLYLLQKRYSALCQPCYIYALCKLTTLLYQFVPRLHSCNAGVHSE